MLLSWLRGTSQKRLRKKIRRRPAPLVLRTEVLEDRAVPSATLVRDINTNTGGSLGYGYGDSTRSVELNGHLYFFADDGVHGRELWSTDGTEVGTQLVKDINPGPTPANWQYGASEMARVGDHIVFAADDGVHGSELWISDGTAAGTQMAKDIAPGSADEIMPGAIGPLASSPANFHEVNGHVFFIANDISSGQELWVTDGTSDGTHLVKDINPGIQSGYASNFTTFGDKLYFSADDGVHGNELWVSDGTNDGTHMVADIGQAHSAGDAGEISSNPMNLTVAAGKLFFTADDGLHGNEIWVTDGTEAGTHIVIDLNTKANTDFHGVERTDSSNPYGLTAVGDRVYFIASDDEMTMKLWSTDGTGEGTGQVAPALDLGMPYILRSDGSTLYFATGTSHDGVYATELWKTDGTTDGTTRLMSSNEPPYGDMPYGGVSDILAQGDDVYFTAGNVLGKVIDGGTGVVQKFGGQAWGNPTKVGTLNGKLLLAGDDGTHGLELWSLDGGSAAMVKDINTTTLSSSPTQLLTIGDVTYFVADDGQHGQGLWKSDGTGDGTVLVKSFFTMPNWPIGIMSPTIMPWYMGPGINNLTDYSGALAFTANDGIHGEQLWISDGTEAGTVMITGNDIPPTDGGDKLSAPNIVPWFGSGIGNLTVVGKQLFFTNNPSWNTAELWKTNGSVDGTVIVAKFSSPNIAPPPMPMAADGSPASALYPYWGSLLSNLTNVNGMLFFAADDGEHGAELWKSDGTADGTLMVKDINPNSQPPLTIPGDPTPPGAATPLGSSPDSFVVLNGKLYFSADDGTHGRELWVSDGTDAGTQMVIDLAAGDAGGMLSNYTAGSAATDMIAAGDKLYFNADDGVHGQELWSSDGTAAGTHLVRNIHPDDGAPLYDSGPMVKGSSIQSLTEVGPFVFFCADDGMHGQELWKTDGTAAGTVLVHDIYEGDDSPFPGAAKAPNGSMPAALTNINGMLYFTATNPEHGTELWMSDGTAGGTVIAAEVVDGPVGSAMGYGPPGSAATKLGNKILFVANDPAIGQELYTTDAGIIMTLADPPVSAGGPYHTAEGGKLELHGVVKDRPDANRLHYAWDLDGDGEFDDAKGQDPTMVGAQLRALGLFGGPEAHVIHLRVTDAAGAEVGTASADVLVDDAPLTATGVSLDVTEGQKFNRNVASFKDSGGFEDLSHYSANIDWGDGSTSAGTIIRDGSNLRVAGSHTYSHHGNYSVQVQIQDDGGPAVTATSTVLVHDAGLYAGRTFVCGTAGRTLSDSVATFRDLNPAGSAADFSADIDWGDGTTSTGSIVAGGAGYQVIGTHAYAASGDYAVKVTIHSSGGSSAMAQSSARIDAVHITPRGLTANTTVNSDASLTLAAFRDSGRGASASFFSAMIDWADGSTSAGEVTSDGSGGFRVGGSHRYARTGLFSVKVTMQDTAGNSAQTIGTVRVTN